MKKIDSKSIITLENGDEYIVVKSKMIDEVNYAYVINTKDQTDDGFIALNTEKLRVVTDPEMLKHLFETL